MHPDSRAVHVRPEGILDGSGADFFASFALLHLDYVFSTYRGKVNCYDGVDEGLVGVDQCFGSATPVGAAQHAKEIGSFSHPIQREALVKSSIQPHAHAQIGCTWSLSLQSVSCTYLGYIVCV